VIAHLFHTCLVNEIDPDVGMAVVRVLEHLGVEVIVPPDQTCCGQPAHNAGFHEEAREVASHALRVLDGPQEPIVIPSGSCADMVVHQYPILFKDDPVMLDCAERVGARCREFSQYLAEVAPAGVGGQLTASVAFHPSCHLLRGLGVRDQPLAALNGIVGVRQANVRDQEECCGFGGLFSIKDPEISTGMLDRKLTSLERSGADRVVSCDLGCLLHIGGGLHRRGSRLRVQHLAQLLDDSIRGVDSAASPPGTPAAPSQQRKHEEAGLDDR
jgi:L-lactate dehydrogenase complex protein LldE